MEIGISVPEQAATVFPFGCLAGLKVAPWRAQFHRKGVHY
jgi:hypothetical protein